MTRWLCRSRKRGGTIGGMWDGCRQRRAKRYRRESSSRRRLEEGNKLLALL
jgi:hypothetical protein